MLLDYSHAFEFYATAMGAYNYAQAKCKCEHERYALQQEYLKDVVYLFIATVCYDLAASHGMIDMSMEEVENYQLAKELQHAKTKLTVIDGGKKECNALNAVQLTHLTGLHTNTDVL